MQPAQIRKWKKQKSSTKKWPPIRKPILFMKELPLNKNLKQEIYDWTIKQRETEVAFFTETLMTNSLALDTTFKERYLHKW